MKFAVHFSDAKLTSMMQHAGLLAWVKTMWLSLMTPISLFVQLRCNTQSRSRSKTLCAEMESSRQKIILTGCGTNITLTDLADESVTLVPVDH